MTIADTLFASVVVAVIGYFATVSLIPTFMTELFNAGLKGKDLNKPEKLAKEIPESIGIVSATIFLVSVILIQVSRSFQLPASHTLAEYNAALTSICFMIFLGFADDVLNLRWRYKLFLPLVASLPLVVAYSGATSFLVPKPFVPYIGQSVELGILFKAYICLLTIFCTNSINILAGINGLEAGQSLIISVFIIIYNLIELNIPSYPEAQSRHLFSISLMAPFAATTLGVLQFNWYPSAVFVGDTYTYFAGVTFAVVGILGHFPKTLMLFFIPQLLNFIVSLPQLLKIVPCPRHRLPKFNEKTGKLDPTPNYNLVNIFLRIFGPRTERQLCCDLLIFQAVTCALGIAVRLWADVYL
eukprot:c7201_g1_i1.p1 GENE.c7201_g1_i1~~c7201_g1_i1.p1  ORF type:complete len:356 (+),score=80.26 c7201_g1_i1:40-1107(+)